MFVYPVNHVNSNPVYVWVLYMKMCNYEPLNVDEHICRFTLSKLFMNKLLGFIGIDNLESDGELKMF